MGNVESFGEWRHTEREGANLATSYSIFKNVFRGSNISLGWVCVALTLEFSVVIIFDDGCLCFLDVALVFAHTYIWLPRRARLLFFISLLSLSHM
jgi:hypothetical protein